MKKNIIYVRLLDEGVKVYRPVPAFEVANNVYQLNGADIYDPDDETWEFPPDSIVRVEEQSLSDECVLVAIGIV